MQFGTAVQRFHIGAGSVAVPGTAAGLGDAHRRFGSLPWAELVAPAAALARAGVVQTTAHARLNEILLPVVTLTPESRAIWAPGGHVLTEGETMHLPALADTLDHLAETGADDLYTGRLADALVVVLRRDGRGADGARPGLVPRDPPPAGRGDVPRVPHPHQRAAVVRRPAAGVRPGAARPPRRRGRPARRAGGAVARGHPARGGGAARARARAGAVPQRRATAARRPVGRARPGPAAGRPAAGAAARGGAGGAARHEPRLGRGRGGQRGGDDELDRLRLGRVRRLDRPAPQQHAGRGGPDRPRLAAARRAADVDDVADHRRGARRLRPGGGIERLGPDPLGHAPGAGRR